MHVWLSDSGGIYVIVFRFIGSAAISLKDLASGQLKSLPSKNVPLMNEKQHAIGVNAFS